MKMRQHSSKLYLLCVIFCFIFLSSIAANSQTVTVTRTIPDRYVPGGEVDVTLNIEVSGSPRLLMDVVEYFPYGWHYKSSNIEPNELEDGDYLAWEFAPVSDSYTITYTLQVPADESGPKGFLCEVLLVYSYDLDRYFTVAEGDNLILGPEGGDVTAIRDTPDTYQQGQLFTVGIQLDSNYPPQSVLVEETFDASVFEVGVISPPGLGVYLGQENGRGKIQWDIAFYTPPMNLTYALTPTSEGTGPSFFEGQWSLTTGDKGPIQGDQQIVLYQENQPEPEPEEGCFRTFLADPKIYTPEIPLSVKLEFKTTEDVYGLTVSDRIPEGWTFTETGEGFVAGQTITWTPDPGQAVGNQTYQYTTLPPAGEAGQKIFFGGYAFRPSRLSTDVYYYLTEGDEIIGDGQTDIKPAPIDIVRTLPNAYEPKQTVDVTLAYDIQEASPPTELTINESIPKDWQLIAANPPQDSTTARSIRWVLTGEPVTDGVITYTLQVKAGEVGDQLFTGSYSANSGLQPVAGTINGDTILPCGSCQCPVYYDEGGIPGLINQYELLRFLERVRGGTEETRNIFCFKRFWYETSFASPTATPTP